MSKIAERQKELIAAGASPDKVAALGSDRTKEAYVFMMKRPVNATVAKLKTKVRGLFDARQKTPSERKAARSAMSPLVPLMAPSRLSSPQPPLMPPEQQQQPQQPQQQSPRAERVPNASREPATFPGAATAPSGTPGAHARSGLPAATAVPVGILDLPAREVPSAQRDGGFPVAPKPSAALDDPALVGKLGARDTTFVLLPAHAGCLIYQRAINNVERSWPDDDKKSKKLRSLNNGQAAIQGSDRLAKDDTIVVMSWDVTQARAEVIQAAMMRTIDKSSNLDRAEKAIRLAGSLVPPGMRIMPTVDAPLNFFSISDGLPDDDEAHSQERLDHIARLAIRLACRVGDRADEAEFNSLLGGDEFMLRRAVAVKPRKLDDFLGEDPLTMAEVITRRNQHQPTQCVWAKPTSVTGKGHFEPMLKEAGISASRAAEYAVSLSKQARTHNRSGIGDRQHGQAVEHQSDGNGMYSPRTGFLKDDEAADPIVESHLEDEAAFCDYQRIAFEHASPMTAVEQREAEQQRMRFKMISMIGPLYHGESAINALKYMHADKAGQGELLLMLTGLRHEGGGSDGVDYGDEVLGCLGATTAIAFFSIGFLLVVYSGTTIVCFDGEEAEHGAVSVLPPTPVFGGFDDRGHVLDPLVLSSTSGDGRPCFEDVPRLAVQTELAARGALGLSVGFWNDSAGQRQWAAAGNAAPLAQALASAEGREARRLAEALWRRGLRIFSVDAAAWFYHEKSWRARTLSEMKAGWFSRCSDCGADAGGAAGALALCDGCHRGWHVNSCLHRVLPASCVCSFGSSLPWFCPDCADATAKVTGAAAESWVGVREGCSGSGHCDCGGEHENACCSGSEWKRPLVGGRIWCRRQGEWLAGWVDQGWCKASELSLRLQGENGRERFELLRSGEIWGYCESAKRTRR